MAPWHISEIFFLNKSWELPYWKKFKLYHKIIFTTIPYVIGLWIFNKDKGEGVMHCFHKMQKTLYNHMLKGMGDGHGFCKQGEWGG